MKKFVISAALPLLVLGCGSSSSSDPDLDAWEREVRIITPSQLGDRQYEEIGGMLEARDPIRAAYGGEEDAIERAKRELRRRAAKLDADAVVIVECGRHVRPLEEANLPSAVPEVICHGGAIRWLD